MPRTNLSRLILLVLALGGCDDDSTGGSTGGFAGGPAGGSAGGGSQAAGGGSQAAGGGQAPSCEALCPSFASCAAGAMAICMDACAQASAACRACVAPKSCNGITQCDAACGGSFLSPHPTGGGGNHAGGQTGGAGAGQASEFFSPCTPGTAGACLGTYNTCVPFGTKAYCTKDCFVNTDCESVTSQECQQQPSGLKYCVPQAN